MLTIIDMWFYDVPPPDDSACLYSSYLNVFILLTDDSPIPGIEPA